MKIFTLTLIMMLVLLGQACKQFAAFNVPSVSASAQEPPGDPSILFRSGFEDDTQLEAIPSTMTSDHYQHFSGTDRSSRFSWPLTFGGANAERTGIHSIAGSGNRVGNYLNNSIEVVRGPSGELTRALRMQVFRPAPGFCCIQSMFQVAGMSQIVTAVYTRFWLKLNPEAPAQLQASGREFWRTLWELKTFTDYRINAMIAGTRSGAAVWRVIVDNNPNGARPTCPANACWSTDVTSSPVPLERWFLMEIYLHRGNNGDGRFAWAVDGQLLVDHYGPSYGAHRENIDFLALSALYGQDTNMNPAYQWIDDLEVWDRPPCLNFPCTATLR